MIALQDDFKVYFLIVARHVHNTVYIEVTPYVCGYVTSRGEKKQFQEQKVLLSQRWNPFKDFKDKEWWYTGISDASQKLYIGISAIRTKFIDSIDLSVYFADEVGQNIQKHSGGHWEQAAFLGFMKCGKEKDKLDLSVNRDKPQKSFFFDYTDTAGGRKESDTSNNKWKLDFKSEKKNCSMQGSFEITQRIPRFTKYDIFLQKYTLCFIISVIKLKEL